MYCKGLIGGEGYYFGGSKYYFLKEKLPERWISEETKKFNMVPLIILGSKTFWKWFGVHFTNFEEKRLQLSEK